MESLEFVEIINEVVLNSSVLGMQARLEKPAGRSPHKEATEMSTWYNNLKEDDKRIILKIISSAVRLSVFSFLCVLDNVAAIEDGDKGMLKLYYEKGMANTLLNDQKKVLLHELL